MENGDCGLLGQWRRRLCANSLLKNSSSSSVTWPAPLRGHMREARHRMESFWSKGSPDVAGNQAPPADGQIVTTASRNVGPWPGAPSRKTFPIQGTDSDLESELESLEAQVTDWTECTQIMGGCSPIKECCPPMGSQSSQEGWAKGLVRAGRRVHAHVTLVRMPTPHTGSRASQQLTAKPTLGGLDTKDCGRDHWNANRYSACPQGT